MGASKETHSGYHKAWCGRYNKISTKTVVIFSRKYTTVETSVVNDTINFEVRIVEGKPTYFNKISVVGNEKTNDYVIYRELRTRPGYLYSKDAL